MTTFLNQKINGNIPRAQDVIQDKINNTYEKIPIHIRYLLPTSNKSMIRLNKMTRKAKKSRVVPSMVSNALFRVQAATVLKSMAKKRSGGKKSKKQNSYTKKTKKQNKYTKKEKRKINGVIKVIYTKKNSRKLYVKSKGKMMNLKRYKKISKKR